MLSKLSTGKSIEPLLCVHLISACQLFLSVCHNRIDIATLACHYDWQLDRLPLNVQTAGQLNLLTSYRFHLSNHMLRLR